MTTPTPAAPGAELRAGQIRWSCTDEDSGPDVGISLGLGDGKELWVGEITRAAHEAAGPDIAALGNDGGWWLALYDPEGPKIIGRVDQTAASDLIDMLSAAWTRRPAPDAVEAMREDLVRPIIGIANRTALEVFDIMCDRIVPKLAALLLRPPAQADAGGEVARLDRGERMRDHKPLDEARRRLALTEGCLDCNADDERFWRAVIQFLEEVA